ncbi:MAG: O-methyltransferase [Actinomycetales bacterium]|nr:O-methyltransferase [Actinomycetales bacterium]
MPSQPPDPGQDVAFDEPVQPLADACVTYADEWLDEDELVRSARAKAYELGCRPVSRTVATALTLLARAIGAKAVVEVGTGAGVSAAALLDGMSDQGVLTSIDVEAEHQRVARETLGGLGYDHVRARLIAGRALEVLPRLADGAYDLMFVDGDPGEYPSILAQGRRLLRPGGLVAFDQVLSSGLLPDFTRRDAETTALRTVVHEVRDDGHWHPALLPIGGGLLVAMRRSAD